MRPTRGQTVIPGIPHHVILRGNNRRRIFSYAKDYLYFLSRFRQALLESDCEVHALALMPNHVHVLTTPQSVDGLATLIKRVSQAYAVYRNRSREATGKLFEQRYEAKPVDDERYLAYVTVYVDSNPVRAGIVDDPLQQEWTTYGIHVGRPDCSRIPLALWTPSEWYGRLAPSPQARAAHYQEIYQRLLAEHAQRVEEKRLASALDLEAKLQATYTHRLMRPDGSRAHDGAAWYRRRRPK